MPLMEKTNQKNVPVSDDTRRLPRQNLAIRRERLIQLKIMPTQEEGVQRLEAATLQTNEKAQSIHCLHQ